MLKARHQRPCSTFENHDTCTRRVHTHRESLSNTHDMDIVKKNFPEKFVLDANSAHRKGKDFENERGGMGGVEKKGGTE